MPQLAVPDVEIVVNAPCWDEPGASGVVRRAMEAVGPLGAGGAVTVVLTDDAEIQILNKEWRGVDKPTNVLSFPAAPLPDKNWPGGPGRLGDVIIAYETVTREAADEGKPFANHLSHLAIHGFLHLIGYDHDTDAKAEIMEGLERKVLASLGIPDPYAND